jgi:hypothetical protein
MMKRITFLLAFLAAAWGGALTARTSTNLVETNRILIIDPSTMPVAAGHATLTIGPLRRAGGVYSGDYKISVSPYFFKNEKGRLAINVSDVSLAEIAQGKPSAITGTATTSGKGGESRPIVATATPSDLDHGTIKLWFTAGERKMIFEPAYHFAARVPTKAEAMLQATNRTTNLNSDFPVAYRANLNPNPNPNPNHP